MAGLCECGRAIPPQVGPGRPRTKCEECSPTRPRNRGAKTRPAAVVRLPPPATERPQETPAAPGGLLGTTRAQLAAHGRDETPDGVLALTLAASIEQGTHTGSSLAALAREFRTVLAAAMEGTTPTADVIDGIFGSKTG